MQALSQSRFSLRDTLRILFRFQQRSALVFVVTCGLICSAVCLTPQKYASEARMYVKMGRESVALDPTATTGPTLQVYESRESEIRSLLDVLNSRVVREQVVDQLGAPVLLGGDGRNQHSLSLLGRLRQGLMAVGLAAAVSERERAIRTLSDSIDVESSKKSAVVVVRGQAKSPQLAQQITAAHVDAYYNLHYRAHRTAGSHEFFAEQAEQQQQQLAAATRELRDLKNQVEVVSINGQRSILERHVSSLDRELLVTDASLHAARDRLKTLRCAHPQSGQTASSATASGLSSAAIDDMRDQLYTLQIRQRELAAMYNPSHPRVVAIDEQVQAAQQVLDEQELKIEQSQVAALQAKVASLQDKYAAARNRLRKLNESEVRIGELERQVELLQESYKTYARNRELTRMDASLERQRISNVNLIQPASFVEQPVGPKRLTILVLGLVTACLAALATALASEYFDHSLKTAADVELQLEVPVLLSIPQLRQRQSLLN